jgi:hypothetical protein
LGLAGERRSRLGSKRPARPFAGSPSDKGGNRRPGTENGLARAVAAALD